MSCGDSGGGMPGRSPRAEVWWAGDAPTVGVALDDEGRGVGRVLTRSVWSSGELHAVSRMTATPRLETRRRIEFSLRDVADYRPPAGPVALPRTCSGRAARPRTCHPSAGAVVERPAKELAP